MSEIRNKIKRLKYEILIKSFYKSLEKAPINILWKYWTQPEKGLYSRLLNNKKEE